MLVYHAEAISPCPCRANDQVRYDAPGHGAYKSPYHVVFSRAILQFVKKKKRGLTHRTYADCVLIISGATHSFYLQPILDVTKECGVHATQATRAR